MRAHQVDDYPSCKRPRVGIIQHGHEAEVFISAEVGARNEMIAGHFMLLSEIRAPRCTKLLTRTSKAQFSRV